MSVASKRQGFVPCLVFVCVDSSLKIQKNPSCFIETQSHSMCRVGKNLKDQVISKPCHGQGHFPLDQVAQGPSNLALNISREGASTAYLDANCLLWSQLKSGHQQLHVRAESKFAFSFSWKCCIWEHMGKKNQRDQTAPEKLWQISSLQRGRAALVWGSVSTQSTDLSELGWAQLCSFWGFGKTCIFRLTQQLSWASALPHSEECTETSSLPPASSGALDMQNTWSYFYMNEWIIYWMNQINFFFFSHQRSKGVLFFSSDWKLTLTHPIWQAN